MPVVVDATYLADYKIKITFDTAIPGLIFVIY